MWKLKKLKQDQQILVKKAACKTENLFILLLSLLFIIALGPEMKILKILAANSKRLRVSGIFKK